MTALDWIVVAVYAGSLLALAAFLSRRQGDLDDYYLGGRKVRWWQSGLSTMATQLGAISFVSAPAFVAVKEGGGLKWLGYEFGVPLALIVVMVVIAPALHRAGVVSIYEYLQQRYDGATRTLVSVLFLLGRGLATAVSVLAGGIILSVALGVDTWVAILTIGAVTIVYDMLGGIRAVVLSDVAQMAVIVAGLVVCASVALSLVGWEAAWQTLDPERLQVLDFGKLGLDREGEYAFWPMAVGGFFLYMSYYGCDQSQMQRELSVGDLHGIRKSLLVNAVGRFPLVLLYCVMGVLIGAVVAQPEFLVRSADHMGVSTAAAAETLARDPDRMVPLFILTYLPPGVVGFLFVAILSALMSSLDSALNSMSAATVRDIYQTYMRPAADARHYLMVSKVTTLLWGVFCVGFALLFAAAAEATRQTTIVLINAIGSVLYGPILAVFLLGILTRWAQPRAVKLGAVTGVAVNIVLWQATSVAWLWWNVTGFVAAVAVAAGLSALRGPAPLGAPPVLDRSSRGWRLAYAAVLAYFVAMVALSGILPALAGAAGG